MLTESVPIHDDECFFKDDRQGINRPSFAIPGSCTIASTRGNTNLQRGFVIGVAGWGCRGIRKELDDQRIALFWNAMTGSKNQGERFLKRSRHWRDTRHLLGCKRGRTLFFENPRLDIDRLKGVLLLSNCLARAEKQIAFAPQCEMKKRQNLALPGRLQIDQQVAA